MTKSSKPTPCVFFPIFFLWVRLTNSLPLKTPTMEQINNFDSDAKTAVFAPRKSRKEIAPVHEPAVAATVDGAADVKMDVIDDGMDIETLEQPAMTCTQMDTHHSVPVAKEDKAVPFDVLKGPYPKIKECPPCTGNEIILLKDINDKGAKQFYICRSHVDAVTIIASTPSESRCFYEWFNRDDRVRLVFDLENTEPFVYNNEGLQEHLTIQIVERHMEVCESLGMNTSNTNWYTLQCFYENKFSAHLICSDFFDSWELQCAYVNTYFDDLFKKNNDEKKRYNIIDPELYSPGGRALRLPKCTKMGNNAFFEPCDTSIPISDYFATNILASCQRVPFDSSKTTKLRNKWNSRDKKVLKPTSAQTITLQGVIDEHLERFAPFVKDYNSWLSIGFMMATADLTVEDFCRVSALSKKYNRQECERKWRNLVSTVSSQPKNIKRLLSFLKYSLGVEVNLQYTDDLPPSFDMKLLTKEMLMDEGLKTVVRPEFMEYTLQTINRYFACVTSSKVEFFMVSYDGPCGKPRIVERYTRSSLLEAFQPLNTFFMFWLFNTDRRQYRRYDFDPRMTSPPEAYNLYNGLKIELENNIEDYNYDQSKVDPFLNHVMRYFCRSQQSAYDYFLNWFASILQKPWQKNITAIVLKSDDQGCGKGLIINELFGNGIFGEDLFKQVRDIDGLIGKFNSTLMNKLFVNVDEVSMTKAQANQVKGMITESRMDFEKKGLDKMNLPNLSNFVMTSNNQFCVIIDPSDRRYFILDVDDSNANDLSYYEPFRDYCRDPETIINVYKFLMSRDISNFNPVAIPDTAEKERYRQNAIPLCMRFIQQYVEKIDTNQYYTSRVKPDELYERFVFFCNAQHETVWTRKKFEMGIAKIIKAEDRDRSNGSNTRYYNFGNPQEFLDMMKQKRMFYNP